MRLTALVLCMDHQKVQVTIVLKVMKTGNHQKILAAFQQPAVMLKQNHLLEQNAQQIANAKL